MVPSLCNAGQSDETKHDAVPTAVEQARTILAPRQEAIMLNQNSKFLHAGIVTALLLVIGFVSQIATAGDVLHVPRDFATIQDAVDAAAPGDTIQIARGTFTENVLIDGKSDLRIFGRKTLLDGDGIGIGFYVVNSDHIRIQGFAVQAYEAGVVLEDTVDSRIQNIETRFNDSDTASLRDGLQLVGSHHNRISNVDAHDNGHNGITLKDGSTNNVIHNNRTTDNGQNPAVAANFGGCGIQLISSGNDQNTISANVALRNGWGIQVGGGSNSNEIAQNRSHENARAGVVVLTAGEDNFVVQNKAAGNGLADVPPSGTFDLYDQGDLDNTWRNNKGTFNF
jgi:parallel beta-helix repeat protein